MTLADIMILAVVVIVLFLIIFFSVFKKKKNPCANCAYAKQCATQLNAEKNQKNKFDNESNGNKCNNNKVDSESNDIKCNKNNETVYPIQDTERIDCSKDNKTHDTKK